MVGTILVALMVVATIAVFPIWGHSRYWGFKPSGGVAIATVVVLLLVMTGRI